MNPIGLLSCSINGSPKQGTIKAEALVFGKVVLIRQDIGGYSPVDHVNSFLSLFQAEMLVSQIQDAIAKIKEENGRRSSCPHSNP